MAEAREVAVLRVDVRSALSLVSIPSGSIHAHARIPREDDVRQQQDPLRLMAEWLPQLVWTTSAAGTPDWYNQRWYEFTGMPSASGRPLDETPFDWTAYVHEDDRAAIAEAWRRAFEDGAHYETEYRLRHAPSGEHRWVLARGQPLRDERGTIVRWFGTCTDIHDHRAQAERTRRLERAATRMLAATTAAEVVRVAIDESMDALNALGIAVNLYDPVTRQLHIAGASDGPAGQASLKWGPIPLDGEFLVARAARLRETQIIAEDADFERTSSRAATAMRALGIRSATFCPMHIGDRLVGTLGFVFASPGPFTRGQLRFMEELAQQCAYALERARLFEETQDARADAERANKAKSDFLAVMSHELRSPLNAIDGHAALVMDGIHGPVNDAQVAALQRLRRSSRVLLGMINDLLDFSRIEAGRVSYTLRSVGVGELLAQFEELMAPLARERSVGWTHQPIAGDVEVRADSDRALQVLVNLGTNAIKYSREGGRVTVSARPVGDVVEIRVADDGVGIAPDMLDQIFQPFVQVDMSHRRQREGVGLGLAISRDLARGMGGDITVVSEPDRGSTFTLTLPRP